MTTAVAVQHFTVRCWSEQCGTNGKPGRKRLFGVTFKGEIPEGVVLDANCPRCGHLNIVDLREYANVIE